MHLWRWRAARDGVAVFSGEIRGGDLNPLVDNIQVHAWEVEALEFMFS